MVALEELALGLGVVLATEVWFALFLSSKSSMPPMTPQIAHRLITPPTIARGRSNLFFLTGATGGGWFWAVAEYPQFGQKTALSSTCAWHCGHCFICNGLRKKN
jgi:hypothetical protein